MESCYNGNNRMTEWERKFTAADTRAAEWERKYTSMESSNQRSHDDYNTRIHKLTKELEVVNTTLATERAHREAMEKFKVETQAYVDGVVNINNQLRDELQRAEAKVQVLKTVNEGILP
jgi:uncharacterized protein YPO0396